jgi:hypothetical protein
VKIDDRLSPTAEMTFSRYRAGGLQDPQQLPRNWNRTFELVPEQIQGGALLPRGLTDSPYSPRRIGEIFHGKGFYVLGLRLPGHGKDTGSPYGSGFGRTGWRRAASLERYEDRSDLPCRLTIITNAAPDSQSLVRRTKAPRSQTVATTIMDLVWPPGVYSLSHVAIPFSPDDPVYGSVEDPDGAYRGLAFGRLQPRGETHYVLSFCVKKTTCGDIPPDVVFLS